MLHEILLALLGHSGGIVKDKGDGLKVNSFSVCFSLSFIPNLPHRDKQEHSHVNDEAGDEGMHYTEHKRETEHLSLKPFPNNKF